MAGGVAHDFNNVLMAMLGHAEMSLRKIPASSPARNHLQHLQKNIHRASELTRRMLAYAGKASFVKEAFHVESILYKPDRPD